MLDDATIHSHIERKGSEKKAGSLLLLLILKTYG